MKCCSFQAKAVVGSGRTLYKLASMNADKIETTEDNDIQLDAPRKEKPPFKLYPQLDVLMSYQNMGSAWLIILRGKKEEIELTFNGLYNLMATNGELRYTSGDEDTGLFWSSPEEIWKFFKNKFDMAHENAAAVDCEAQANIRFAHFKQFSEVFMDFHNVHKDTPDYHDIGATKAENPDADFREAMWAIEGKAPVQHATA